MLIVPVHSVVGGRQPLIKKWRVWQLAIDMLSLFRLYVVLLPLASTMSSNLPLPGLQGAYMRPTPSKLARDGKQVSITDDEIVVVFFPLTVTISGLIPLADCILFNNLQHDESTSLLESRKRFRSDLVMSSFRTTAQQGSEAHRLHVGKYLGCWKNHSKSLPSQM
jgi:hypothetical protein